MANVKTQNPARPAVKPSVKPAPAAKPAAKPTPATKPTVAGNNGKPSAHQPKAPAVKPAAQKAPAPKVQTQAQVAKINRENAVAQLSAASVDGQAHKAPAPKQAGPDGWPRFADMVSSWTIVTTVTSNECEYVVYEEQLSPTHSGRSALVANVANRNWVIGREAASGGWKKLAIRAVNEAEAMLAVEREALLSNASAAKAAEAALTAKTQPQTAARPAVKPQTGKPSGKPSGKK